MTFVGFCVEWTRTTSKGLNNIKIQYLNFIICIRNISSRWSLKIWVFRQITSISELKRKKSNGIEFHNLCLRFQKHAKQKPSSMFTLFAQCVVGNPDTYGRHFTFLQVGCVGCTCAQYTHTIRSICSREKYKTFSFALPLYIRFARDTLQTVTAFF